MANDYFEASELSSFIAGFELNDTAGEGVLTTAQADLIIETIEADLNGIISSLGFEAPVLLGTSPRSFRYIRSIAVQGILALVQGVIHSLTDDTEGSREQAFWRRYELAIKRLYETGGSALVDLDPIDGESTGNMSPALGQQRNNVDRLLTMRDLTGLRHRDNAIAAARLMGGRGVTRFFEGGVPVSHGHLP